MSARQKRKSTFTTTTATTTTIGNANETAKLKRQIIEKVLSNKTNGVSSISLGALSEGWLELESDPSTFSLLVEDLGCFGAQVDEIYDLEQKFDGPVYGFIFLFKWLNNNHHSDRNSRNQSKTVHELTSTTKDSAATPLQLESMVSTKDSINATSYSNNNNHRQSKNDQAQQLNQYDQSHTSNSWSYVVDTNIINEIFFAKQMISNSCATHALISVLLNCDRDELDLGPTLTHLREYTRIMAPEDKGDRPYQQRGLSFAIRGNQRTNLQQSQNQPETYHFVSYVPIKNRLYELDGLKNFPIDHGPLDPNEDWTEKFRRVIKQRLVDNKSDGGDAISDIRYNLMAVVPDRRLQLMKQSCNLKCHLDSIKDSVVQLEKSANITESNHKTTSIGCQNDAPPFSPNSNGTLTASETGSVCAESPRRLIEIEPSDLEIPHPPYSPLSNDTLSASETGSVCNSPTRFEDSIFSDEKNPPKHYYIRFDKTPSEVREDESIKKDDKIPISIPDQRKNEQKLQAVADLKRLSRYLQRDIEKNESSLGEETDKRRKYKIDNSRRTHNYEPFIMTFLSMLAKQGNLAELIEKNLGWASMNIRSANEASATYAVTQQPTSSKRQYQMTKQLKQPPHIPLQVKGTNSYSKLKQEPGQDEQQQKQLTSSSGRPIRATKSKYISTGRPRGRPRKIPL